MNVAPRTADLAARAGALPSLGTAALVAVVALATAVAVVGGNGSLAVAVAPIALATTLCYAVSVPLRSSASVLLTAMLAIDTTTVEGSCPEGLVCRWRTPLVSVGDLIHGPLPGLPITGMEVALALLLGIAFHRKVLGSRIDGDGAGSSASPLLPFVLLYVAAVAFADAYGVARGGEIAVWKLRNLLHPIALFLVFHAAFRSPRDHRLLGRVIVLSACFRAVLAVVIQAMARAESGGPLESGTSHGDSLLFAAGMFVLLAEIMERADRRQLVRAALLLPILVFGVLENDRRLAWVMIAMMLGLAFVITPAFPWKRSLVRLVAVAAPLLLLYAAIGWNREGFLFRPVRIFRGVTDTSVDHSAYWREVENWNIVMSMRDGPVMGIGLGQQYTEHMQNDDITADYAEFREWPHNSVLGLLLFLGLFAFTATWCLPAVGVFLAARSYPLATQPLDRAAALSCIAILLGCHLLAWGDTGAHFPQYKILFALALAASGRLAIATGAWPSRARGGPGAAPAPLPSRTGVRHRPPALAR